MKKLTGYALSWTLYWLGHWTSLTMDRTNSYWLYSMYNWFMWKSSVVQDWSGTENGPWCSLSSAPPEHGEE